MSVFPTGVIRAGNDIVFRLCDEKGNRKTIRERYKPEIFVPAPYGTATDVADAFALRGEPDPRDLTPLVRMEFDNIWDFKQYIDENKDVPGVRLYGDADPVVQAFTKAFPGEIQPEFKHIRSFNLDIEVISSYLDEKQNIVRGPFPLPIIEREEFQTKKFNAQEYADYITKFYQWWRSEFPNSSVPTWTNMNAAFPIVSLQLSDKQAGKYIIWDLPMSKHRDCYEYDPEDKDIPGLNVEIRQFDTEQAMLTDFIKYWAAREPDCWTGWNISGFDSPYMAERILKILGEDWLKALSPVGRFRKTKVKPKKGLPYQTYEFTGCFMLDYVELYKKHRLKERARYSLDYIAHVELGERKLDYGESKSLNNMWFENHERFLRYGIKDIYLVDKIDKRLGFLNLTYMLAALYHCNYSETMATVSPWNSLLFWENYHHREEGQPDVPRVPLIRKPADGEVVFDGAFVHDPLPGRYEDIVSEDLNSLYPHIEQQYNMGPETKVTEQERQDILYELAEELEGFSCDFNRNRHRVALIKAIREEREIIEELIKFGPYEFETLKRHGVSMTPNLQFFINDKMSCYSRITRNFYSKRKVFKGEMLKWEQVVVNLKGTGVTSGPEYDNAKDKESGANTAQMGVKIVINSGYGGIANKWLTQYFDVATARAITACGELINKWVTFHITQFLRDYTNEPNHRFVVYGDTDSIYLNLTPVNKMKGWDSLTDKEYVDAVDEFEKTVIQPQIEKFCQEMATTMNAFEQRMFWGREVICRDGGIFQAKKRYALLVNDSEGVHYEKPKLKVTGLESKKSSTPEICVGWLENSYKLAIQNKQEELFDYVKECRETYLQQTPDEISTASSVSNVDKYRDGNTWNPIKHTPFQANAAMLHNMLVEQKNGATPLIEDGSKINIVTLKDDNPWGRGYMAFQGFWPEELEEFRDFIDYGGLFEKAFVQPLQLFLEPVGMTTKKKVNVFKFIKKKEG